MIENNEDKIKDLLPEASLLLKGFFRGDFCPLKVTYRENDLLQLSKQLQWQGSGTEHDPFIITSSDGLAKEFRVLQSNLYIIFRECNLDIIWLTKTQNIRLENISFKKFILDACQGMGIKGCDIPFLSITDSKDNYFEQTTISAVYNVRSNANIFKNCQFAEGISSIIAKGSFSQAIRYFYLFTLVLGAGFIYFLISSDFTFTLENAPYLIGFGGFFVLALILSIFSWFGRQPSTNYIIVDENSKN